MDYKICYIIDYLFNNNLKYKNQNTKKRPFNYGLFYY